MFECQCCLQDRGGEPYKECEDCGAPMCKDCDDFNRCNLCAMVAQSYEGIDDDDDEVDTGTTERDVR